MAKLMKKKITMAEHVSYSGPRGGKEIDCFYCGNTVRVDRGTGASLCSTCVARLTPGPANLVPAPTNPPTNPPTITKTKKPRASRATRAKRGEGVKRVPSGFPRGWHFKSYYKHTDGKVYSKGQLITDVALIAALKKEYA